MRLLYVPLRPDELTRLKEIAQRERRRPQDQAAVLLAAAMGLRQPEPAGARVGLGATGEALATHRDAASNGDQ